MEIGLLNGDNAKNMVEMAQTESPNEAIEYYGFDVFENNRKNTVSKKLESTGCDFELFSGDSKKTLPTIVDKLPKMDLIFIDGGHDYETVKNDWENSRKLMHKRTGVFFHNYDYSGVEKVVNNISTSSYDVEILDPSSDYRTAFVRIIN